jgi:putative Mg2+ transporter-C (MgtC) family protein
MNKDFRIQWKLFCSIKGEFKMSMDMVHINLFSVIIRLLLAAVIGAVIGIEREHQNQTAGLRTHMLICIGAALTMLTNQFITENLFASADPTRIGAQVISGIGFLGVGTIIVTGKQKVRGLTTAAGLWASACAGLAAGIGFYEGAIAGTIIIFFVMVIVQRVDRYINSKQKFALIYVEVNNLECFDRVKQLLMSMEVSIVDLEIGRINTGFGSVVGIDVRINLEKQKNTVQIISAISKVEGVYFVKKV